MRQFPRKEIGNADTVTGGFNVYQEKDQTNGSIEIF